jgi:hypothetical protein
LTAPSELIEVASLVTAQLLAIMMQPMAAARRIFSSVMIIPP